MRDVHWDLAIFTHTQWLLAKITLGLLKYRDNHHVCVCVCFLTDYLSSPMLQFSSTSLQGTFEHLSIVQISFYSSLSSSDGAAFLYFACELDWRRTEYINLKGNCFSYIVLTPVVVSACLLKSLLQIRLWGKRSKIWLAAVWHLQTLQN